MLERLSRRPLTTLIVLVFLQVVPTLWSRGFWAYDEVRHADVLRELLEEGHAVSLHLNGAPYPDKPPLWFWVVAPFAKLLGTDGPPAFFLASGLAGFLLLAATLALARATVARRPATAFVAPLLLAVTPLFQVLLRTTRMDLLFGTLILVSELLWIRGLRREGPNRHVFLALVAGGLATLVKGPLGVLLPLVAAAAVLAWQGRLKRLLARDVLLGALAVAGLVGGWLGALAAVEGGAYVRQLLEEQVFHRALAATHHRGPVWIYAAALPVLAAPWPLLLAALAWRRPFARERWRRVWAARRSADDGRAWLVSIALTGFLLLSAGSSKFVIYLLPLFPPLAVLAAELFMRLPQPRLRRAWVALGVLGLALAGALPFVDGWVRLPVRIGGLVPTALLLGLTALLALLGRDRRRERVLAWFLSGLAAVALVVALWVAPSLDPLFDPGPQARTLAAYADEGYAPLVFRVYPGTYAYHARRALPETRDPEALAAHRAAHARVVVATSEKETMRHPERFAGLVLVHRQWIEARPFVLLATPGEAGAAPGEDGGDG